MKIALFCKRYYTNKDLIRDRFGRLFHVPVGLADLGADVRVVALDYRCSRTQEQKLNGVGFKTLPGTAASLPWIPWRIFKELSKDPPDVLIASGDSHIGFIAMHIARRLGVAFVFDVYDYYPAFPGNRIPGMKTLFRKAVTGADLVLCASSSLVPELSKWNGKLLLVENGVDRRHFAPTDVNEARRQLGIREDAKVIGYFGSINPQRGPLLIDACRELVQEYANLCLLMAGRVNDIDLDEPWIDYRGELDQEQVPLHISACDVVAIPYANDAFNSMAGACKIAEYLSCARPVVATRVSDHEVIFKNTPNALCEPYASDLARALRRQLEFPEMTPFPMHLEWKTIAAKLFAALETMVDSRRDR